MAQQIGKEVDEATRPFQYALSCRVGTECVSHILSFLTSEDDQATILSIDGIGAFDSISRQSMMEKIHSLPEASRLLPFIRLFYGSPSEYTWEDDAGRTHIIPQGEGGEQGDALMPLLYALGQYEVLKRVQERLGNDE